MGQRKAEAVLDAGARVLLVALEPAPANCTHPRLEWRQQPYERAHLQGAALVFAAATPEVNRQVVADAQALGLWVNSASAPEEGDFYLPATLRRGALVVSVSTGGQAPAFSRALRQRLEDEIDPVHGVWLDLLAEVRPTLLAQVPSEKQAALWQRLCAPVWLERLRRESRAVVRRDLWAELQTLVGEGMPPL